MKKYWFLLLLTIIGIGISQNISQDENITEYNVSLNLTAEDFIQNETFTNETYNITIDNSTNTENTTEIIEEFYDYGNITLEINKTINLGDLFFFKINGSAKANFSVSISKDGVDIFEMYSMTDENGIFIGNANITDQGLYSISANYYNYTVKDVFEVKAYEYNLNISFMQNYTKNVTFELIYLPDVDISIKFDSVNLSKVYFARTNQNGFYSFNDLFEPNMYNISIFYNNESIYNNTFYVEPYTASEDLSYIVLDNDIISDDVAFSFTGFNFTIDCANHSINASKHGILIENTRAVTILNCNIFGGETAIFVKDSDQIKIENVNANQNKNGLIAVKSDNIEVRSSNFMRNEFYGMLFVRSENISVESTETETRTNLDVLTSLN
ncbi:MAG: NosD domain-containing protein [Candidatus Aenigmatarchaeota archaeon]|nr:hypothetical protein [Candidatus Aenigmarchaeota archaeon]